MTARKQASNFDMNGLKVTNHGTPTASGDAATKGYVDSASTADRSRANHTGTQLAATISDFDSQVRSSRLDQMAAPTASVAFNSQRITGLAEPSGAQDGATKNYVDTQLAGVVSGQVLKGEARVAASSNITIASPGATIDGVSMNNGDIVLLTAQTTASQNGPYVFNGAASAMTRATNWDSSAEAVRGSYWVISEGTRADSLALLTTDAAITLGTTSLAFTFISVAGAAIQRYETTIGAITAGSSLAITHNLGSRFVHVQVFRSASPYDEIDVYVERTSTSQVTIYPDISFSAGEYSIAVKY